MTTSGCTLTLLYVSLVVFDLPLRAGEKIKIGGLALNTLKKLNGAKFGLPSKSMVDAKAIGLGPMELNKYWCIFCTESSAGVNEIIVVKIQSNLLIKMSQIST